MTVTKTIPISVAVSILIGSIALCIALPELAKSSGCYETSPVLFPYAFLFFHLIPSGMLLLPFMLLQFPVYGLFYGRAWSQHHACRAVVWLLASHFILGGAALLLCKIDYHVSRGHYPF